MCNAPATSKEHAPPSSFFPEGYRANLITVPSCAKHNNDNSKDVEYVRGFIVSPIQTTTPAARQHFKGKVLRSYQKSRKLFDRIFKTSEPIIAEGKMTRLVHIELETFYTIMQSIAHALYFYLNNKQYNGKFLIHSIDLVAPKEIPIQHQRNLIGLRVMVNSLNLVEVKMPQPDIFKLSIHQDNPEKFIYEFIFYGGFKVYAVSTPFYYR